MLNIVVCCNFQVGGMFVVDLLDATDYTLAFGCYEDGSSSVTLWDIHHQPFHPFCAWIC